MPKLKYKAVIHPSGLRIRDQPFHCCPQSENTPDCLARPVAAEEELSSCWERRSPPLWSIPAYWHPGQT